jgi:FR47-like protein
MATRRPVIAGCARVGPVYTPTRWRGKGYGSAITAAATRDVLDEGGLPVLFTDLANQTSNDIYQRLGYYAVEDRVEIDFRPLALGTGIAKELEQYLVEAVRLIEADRVPAVLDDHGAAVRVAGDGRLGVLAWPKLALAGGDHQHRSGYTFDHVSPVLERVVVEQLDRRLPPGLLDIAEIHTVSGASGTTEHEDHNRRTQVPQL